MKLENIEKNIQPEEENQKIIRHDYNSFRFFVTTKNSIIILYTLEDS